MKKLLLSFCFICFFITTKNGYSQTNNFAPVGAKWWYDDFFNDCSTFPDCGYFTIESIKDTLISGKQCRLLFEKHFELSDPLPDHQYIVYEDTGNVYIFSNDAFHLLYSFNALPEDTITVFGENFDGFPPFEDSNYESFSYKIDSIDDINISGIDMNVQYVSSVSMSDGWGYHNTIIQNIGSPFSLFGFPNTLAPEFGSFLRCYQDFEIYFNNYENDCNYTSTIPDNFIDETILIYPNPIYHEALVQIEMENMDEMIKQDFYYLILDMYGREIRKEQIKSDALKINGNKISFAFQREKIPSGFYMLQIKSGNDILGTRKIVFK